MSFDWTDEAVERLTALWADGLSASQIAEVTPGATRNSIIGKVHRLNLPRRQPRASTAPRRVPERLRTRPRPRVPIIEPVDAHLPPDKSTHAVTLMQLEAHHCRWPIDMPSGPMMYCGATSLEGGPYCPRHHSIAYRDDRRPATGFAGSWKAA